MAESSKTFDLYYTYQFVKRLSTDWKDTNAFKLGIIDKNGKKLRSPKTGEERNAYSLFDRLVFNMKRLLNKTGFKSKLSNFAAAIVLLREGEEILNMSDYEVQNMISEEQALLKKNSFKDFKALREDMAANATGSAVAGTGSDGVHWAKPARVHPTKRSKHNINGVAFLRRRKYKEKQDQLSAAEKMIEKAKQQAASGG
mgnify:CR=1 FL=1|jgi:hypothetical protein